MATVLIVDDSPANFHIVAAILEPHHRIVVAHDGAEGLRCASQLQPDLILLDVMMPGLDGFEVCRRLKAQPQTSQIPVIFMTALSGLEDRITGFDVGGVDYIAKPFQAHEMLARVGTHLTLRATQKQLLAQNAELRQYREGLERLVAVRTADLQLTNFALNRVHEAAFLIGEDARILYVNEAVCRTLGYDAEELRTMTVMDVNGELTAERWASIWRDLRVAGSLTIETVHRRKDGSTFPVEVAVSHFEYLGVAYNLALVRNIAARKLAEMRIHASEQAFRAVVENSPDIIVRYDRECRCTYANPAAARASGCPADELIGKTPLANALPDRRQFVEQLRRVIGTGGEVAEEISMRNVQGETRWSHLRIVPEVGPDGRVATVLAIVRDIHEVKESELRFRTLAENFPDFVVRFDPECRFTYVNPAVAKAFGVPPESFAGKRQAEMPGGGGMDQDEALEALIHRAIATATGSEFEAVFATDAGERIYDIRHVPEKDAAGNVVSVLAVGRDITKLRQAELALRRSVNEFRTLAEHSPDVIVRYDRECRRVYVNPQFERAKGLPACQALGKNPAELATVLAPEAANLMQKLQAVMDSGVSGEIRLDWMKDGKRIFWNVRVVPEYDERGEVATALTIWTDITEHEEAARRLRESCALLRELTSRRETAREDERKRIAREIHDELGQHLTALRMGVSALRMQFGGDHPALAERVQELMTLADKTIRVVREVTTALRPAGLDMGIAAGLEWLAAEFERHSGVRCLIGMPKEKLVLGEDAAIALLRIAQESLTNVARHANAKFVTMTLERQGNDCLLEVCDDGSGFDPAAVRDKSFGLIGMQERVFILGGEVAVAAAPGRGTAIKARIPIAARERM